MRNKLVSIAGALLLLTGLLVVGPSGANASPANADATFFVPVAPCRVVDTRAGAGGQLMPGSIRTWQVGGTGSGFAGQGGKPGGCGIPASARSVELSVSAVTPTGAGFLRAGPSGGARPTATVLQFTALGGTTNTGAVALRSDALRGLTVTGNGAATHVVLDVVGYSVSVAAYPPVDASIYVPFAGPCRVADTRKASDGPLEAGHPRPLRILGTGQIFTAQGGHPPGCFLPPYTTAVMATVSTVSPRGNGFLRTWAAGTPRPIATVAQFNKGVSTSNTATLKLSPESFENLVIETFGATTHAVIDIQGYETAPPRNLLAGSSVYMPMAPCRMADTRSGGGRLTFSVLRGFVAAGSGPSFAAQGGTAGGCGVPSAATAVTASISAVDPTDDGLLRSTLFGGTLVQYQRRTGTTNTGAVTLTEGRIDLWATTGAPHVVVDVSGYYLPQPTPYIGGITRLTDASTDSVDPEISADGRYLAYVVRVANPRPATDFRDEVWVVDRSTSIRTRVSDPTISAIQPSISSDGRYVAYVSSDSPLVPDDTNGVTDVLIWDRTTGATARIYASTSGVSSPSISGDGGVVTFRSADDPTTALPHSTGRTGILVWERATGASTRITALDADAREPVVSGDGRHIAYGIDTGPNESDVFSWDRTTGVTTQVSDGNGRSGSPALSSDGRYLAFGTTATDLVPGDDAISAGVVLWDRTTAVNARVGAFRGGSPALSADGRFVTYLARLPSLDEYNPSNELPELVMIDRAHDTTFRLTAGGASIPSISADGSLIVFHSDAKLVPGDTNDRRDVFLWDRQG